MAQAEHPIGNGDMIMVLLTQDPTKPWNQVMLQETLKIPETKFEAAVAALGNWATLNPAANAIQATDRVGSGTGNGYWAGDQERYEKALRAPRDRAGGFVGNG